MRSIWVSSHGILPLASEPENRVYPVKLRQALLGSNPPRDNRIQVALNDAPEGNSGPNALFPSTPILTFKTPCPCHKKFRVYPDLATNSAAFNSRKRIFFL